MNRLRSIIRDTATVRNRTLRHYWRTPKLLVAATVQPILFLLIFEAVFRGQFEQLHRSDYIEYLLPGILVQGVLFGSTQTGLALAEDMNQGIMDRLRSAPISSQAVLSGRISADIVRNTIVFVAVSVTGVLMGFRFHGSVPEVFLAFILVVAIGVAFSWVQAYLALVTGDPETMQVVGYIWVFPLAFLSSTFVPTGTMPQWLETFAEHQPISYVVDSVRALTKGGHVSPDTLDAFIWIAVILLIFVPLAIRRFSRLD